jgi:regulator of sigma E protease
VLGTVRAGSPAESAGLRAGDRIVSIDGQETATWDTVDMAVLPKAGRELRIVALRDGRRFEIGVTPTAQGRYEVGDLGIEPVFRPAIAQINAGQPAEAVGLRRGDVILAVNGERGLSQEKVVERIRASNNKPLLLIIEREGSEREIAVTPDSRNGVPQIGAVILPYEVRHFDPAWHEAIKLSLAQNWANTVLIGKTLKGLVTGDTPVRQLVGPVGIAEMSGSAAQLGFVALLNLMVMLSLNLGLLNLMPVPIFDGGQMAILRFEGLIRRNLSDRVKERVLIAGAAVVVLLMVTVIYNDISRLLR